MSMFVIVITRFDGFLPQKALTYMRQLISTAIKKKYVVRCHA